MRKSGVISKHPPRWHMELTITNNTGRMHKELHFCWRTLFWHISQNKAFVQMFELQAQYSFHSWMSFSLESTKERQTMAIQIWAFGNHQENEVYHFQENDWQYLLPVIKFKLWSENLDFGKLVSITMILPVSQYLNTLSLVVVLTNVIFLILYDKMCKYLKDLYNSMSPMPDVTESCLVKTSIQSARRFSGP